MDMDVLVAVIVIWGMAAITPGPNFFITIHTAIDTANRLSLFTVLGIVVGTLIWSVAGYLGVSLLFKAVPILYYCLKFVGGLYLVYIGYNLLTKSRNNSTKVSGKYYSTWCCFRLGLFTNLLNPKTAAFMTSLFAATIPPNPSIELGVLVITAICSISAIWYSFVSAVFSNGIAQQIYKNQKQRIEKIAGVIFIGFGAKLALSK